MRTETIRHPFTGALAANEAYLRERLAELEAEYRLRAKPIVDALMKLEDQRRVSHFLVTEPGDTHPAYLNRLCEATQPVLVQEEDDGR